MAKLDINGYNATFRTFVDSTQSVIDGTDAGGLQNEKLGFMQVRIIRGSKSVGK